MKNKLSKIINIVIFTVFLLSVFKIISFGGQIALFSFEIIGILGGFETIRLNKQRTNPDNENAWIFIILGSVMLIATLVMLLWNIIHKRAIIW